MLWSACGCGSEGYLTHCMLPSPEGVQRRGGCCISGRFMIRDASVAGWSQRQGMQIFTLGEVLTQHYFPHEDRWLGKLHGLGEECWMTRCSTSLINTRPRGWLYYILPAKPFQWIEHLYNSFHSLKKKPKWKRKEDRKDVTFCTF